MRSPEDTIAAIATPIGEGGLGIIRVSGKQAIPIAGSIFRNPKQNDLSRAASHTCHVGAIIERDTDAGVSEEQQNHSELADRTIDQAVITLFRAPHSYTGEDVVEIAAHGSPFILQKILGLCVKRGARLAGPGEFTERAFLNGKLDLTQAEAVADLIHAKSDKARASALAQLEGALACEVRVLRDKLLPLLAHVEVGLDHADEDHDFISRQDLIARCRELEASVDEILRSARVAKVLRDGLRVAFLGKPNVGKSSLLNAFLKEDRAIVTPTPGTTRDTLEERITSNGLAYVLIDTAGIRPATNDPIERLGMERTRLSIQEADVVVGLFDGSQPLSLEDEEVVRTAAGKPHVWAINKSDLPRRLEASSLDTLNGKAPSVNISAKTGQNLEALLERLAALAMGESATITEARWLLNARHQAALEGARSALRRASEAAASMALEECVALELQTSLRELGEIIGETSTEDLLDRVFSTFCVGK